MELSVTGDKEIAMNTYIRLPVWLLTMDLSSSEKIFISYLLEVMNNDNTFSINTVEVAGIIGIKHVTLRYIIYKLKLKGIIQRVSMNPKFRRRWIYKLNLDEKRKVA